MKFCDVGAVKLPRKNLNAIFLFSSGFNVHFYNNLTWMQDAHPKVNDRNVLSILKYDKIKFEGPVIQSITVI